MPYGGELFLLAEKYWYCVSCPGFRGGGEGFLPKYRLSFKPALTYRQTPNDKPTIYKLHIKSYIKRNGLPDENGLF